MKRKRVSSFQTKLPMRLLMLMLGLFVAGIHVIVFRMAGTQGLPLPLMLLVLLIDALLVWWSIIFMTQSRVTLYEEGIELERGGSRLFTSWDNVSHLGIKLRGKNSQRGLFLHERVTPETSGLAERLMFGWATNFIPIGLYVHLPRDWNIFNRKIDTDKLLETEFGQELYAHAPHLFEDEEKDKRGLRLQDYPEQDESAALFDAEEHRHLAQEADPSWSQS